MEGQVRKAPGEVDVDRGVHDYPSGEHRTSGVGEGRWVAEYGGACGGSNRAVGRETYRGYGEQVGAERAADGKQ